MKTHGDCAAEIMCGIDGGVGAGVGDVETMLSVGAGAGAGTASMFGGAAGGAALAVPVETVLAVTAGVGAGSELTTPVGGAVSTVCGVVGGVVLDEFVAEVQFGAVVLVGMDAMVLPSAGSGAAFTSGAELVDASSVAVAVAGAGAAIGMARNSVEGAAATAIAVTVLADGMTALIAGATPEIVMDGARAVSPPS